ncbi:hypothetical protein J8L98_02150 [Pseudoalteromonas sp. MMG013]|uniref:hypothetical protein n=1 Tax=unclassified Pseudoalteromonas TaxID=194690 RepID=UPI001B3700FA|nr:MULTISPECIES: hypothetical protein [unclassified Pseudoalteromonas]MBQ4852962.1 hypothetical protein [Pseudoalteromonas sp. MMG012]MBQ4860494.1 hypothetical protein [Pseudoalteromonas sp. MMG013]
MKKNIKNNLTTTLPDQLLSLVSGGNGSGNDPGNKPRAVAPTYPSYFFQRKMP